VSDALCAGVGGPAPTGRVNFGGRPPAYFGANESNPSSLKLCRTSRTRSGEVKATPAIWATSIPWAESGTSRSQAMFATKGLRLSVDRRDGLTIVPSDAESSDHDHWVDLVSLETDQVTMANYGSGPSEILAIMATEQRWLVEQEGSGSASGQTYVEKALERLRICNTLP
jgi:hypothetical protein